MSKSVWMTASLLLLIPAAGVAQGRGRGAAAAGARDSLATAGQARGQTAVVVPQGPAKQGLPPGLQKHVATKGTLPPGLQRQVETKGTLPPGLAKRGGIGGAAGLSANPAQDSSGAAAGTRAAAAPAGQPPAAIKKPPQ
jgi:hypothetical protein